MAEEEAVNLRMAVPYALFIFAASISTYAIVGGVAEMGYSAVGAVCSFTSGARFRVSPPSRSLRPRTGA
jgi:hypothetical protein